MSVRDPGRVPWDTLAQMPQQKPKQTARRKPWRVPEYVPWQDRPRLPVDAGAEILGYSRAYLYKLSREGKLSLMKDPDSGRTFVATTDVIRLLEQSRPFTPTGKDPRGQALNLTRKRLTPQAAA